MNDLIDEAEYSDGSEAGALWVKTSAALPELDRLAKWNAAQADYTQFMPELVARIIVPNTLARDFWRTWQADAYPTTSYVAGFVEGALEVARETHEERE